MQTVESAAVEPHHRIVFTWGFGDVPDEPSNPFPPRSTTVEVVLVPDGEATIVRVKHRVPAHLAHFQAMGWEHYLARLAIMAGGGDPGPDAFVEFVEAMAAGNE